MLAKRNRSVAGSCWSCKDRRVACDLTKPICVRCEQSDLECSYDPVRYRWRPSKGRAPKKPRQSSSRSGPAPLLLKGEPVEDHFVYFTRELTPRLKASNIDGPLDISTLCGDEAFRAVIIALSCTHQSMTPGPSKPSRIQSIEAQQNAISALRKAASSQLSQTALRQFFQASALLSVIFGMMDPCRNGVSIRTQLEATKAVLDKVDKPQIPLQREPAAWTFLLSIFATMELVNAVLTGHEPLFGPETWSEFGSCFCWWGIVLPEDPFLEAMALFSRLAAVGASVHRHDTPIEIGALLAMHSAVHEPRRPKEGDHAVPDVAAEEWKSFCAVYRNSASLYLYRAIARLPLTHPLVRLAVRDTLDVIDLLPRHSRSCILLPLVVLGLNCIDDGEVGRMRGFICDIRHHLSFGAVVSLQDCLETHWTALNTLSASSRIECLDWWASLTDIADSVCLF